MTLDYVVNRKWRGLICGSAAAFLTSGTLASSAASAANPSLAGTWSLVAADKETSDGVRSRDHYGEHPKGRLFIDAKGRYSVEIFRPELANFAAGETEPTPEEYRDAMEAASVHYGQIRVDWTTHTLSWAIEGALYPNLRGVLQERPFEYNGEVLTYRQPRNAQGVVRISVWRREK